MRIKSGSYISLIRTNLFRLNPQVLAMVCEDCGKTLSSGENIYPGISTVPAPSQVTHKDVVSATQKFQTYSKREFKSSHISRDKEAQERPKIFCWRCRSTDSHGPWHRNKRDRDKFLCNICLRTMYERREEKAI